MMISHHTGALAMAKTELTDGQNPDDQWQSRSTVSSQTTEITTPQQPLISLPSA